MRLALRLFCFILTISSVTVLAIEKSTLIPGEVLEFGSYRIIESKPEVPVIGPDGNPRPSIHISPTIEFLSHTNYIVAKKGVSFGFTYKLVNLPTNSPIEFQFETVHPAMITPNGERNEGRTLNIPIQSKDGTFSNHIGYRLDEDFELVEGDWKFSLTLHGRTVVSKTFHLRKE